MSAAPAGFDCDCLVLGAGPGGYSAAFRAADLGLSTILVERHAELGGVCLNVGCIPSKALLHASAVIDAARGAAAHGISFGEPVIDLDRVRGWKDATVGRLTSGLASMAKARRVTVVRGVATLTDPHTVTVTTAEGPRSIRCAHVILAAGSRAARLPHLPDDPRILDSTAALTLPLRPGRLLVVGGGVIGLELGTVYSTFGARLDVVEATDRLMPGADRDLVAVWQRFNRGRFDRVLLQTRLAAIEPRAEGLLARFEGVQAPAEPVMYDAVLVATGRTANGRSLGLEHAGVIVDDRGVVPVDSQRRTNVPHIFAIGDLTGAPMLAHKAVHEGHVAAEVVAGHRAHFDARVIPAVAYTDPEIAWVGVTEDEAASSTDGPRVAKFPWVASGRAIANARDEGLTKLLFDRESGRIVGGGIAGTGAGDLIGEITLAIEMGADAVDLGRTIHAHPTLAESIGLAADVAAGTCTDLPPPRRRA